jgi:hypothetical protein
MLQQTWPRPAVPLWVRRVIEILALINIRGVVEQSPTNKRKNELTNKHEISERTAELNIPAKQSPFVSLQTMPESSCSRISTMVLCNTSSKFMFRLLYFGSNISCSVPEFMCRAVL